jgi:hypothetical protein
MTQGGLREVALSQRLLVRATLATFVMWFLGMFFLPAHFTSIVMVAVIVPLQAYCVWRLASALELSTAKRALYLMVICSPVVPYAALLVCVLGAIGPEAMPRWMFTCMMAGSAVTPLISVAFLVSLNETARKTLKGLGVTAGFLGAKPSDLL